jgi:hypothetical protein
MSAADIENKMPHSQAIGKDQADEKEDDNRSVHSDNSEESPEEKGIRDAILNKFDSTVKHITREEMTKADWTILIAPLLLTAVVGFGYKFDLRGELYGETRLQVGTTVNTYGLTEPAYRYVNMDMESSNTIDTLIEVLTYNNYIFLAPYLIARFSELTQYLYDAAYCPYQKTKINPFIKSATVLATFIAALAIGGTVASQFYSANIGFDDEFELDAKEITPYLWVLYTADAFLRYSQFKDRILQYFYVTKKDDLETSNARKSIIQNLRYSKAVVALMSDEELLQLDIKKVPAGAIDNERRMHGLDSFQNLIDIGKDKTKRRYSIKTDVQKHELSQKFSMYDFLSKNMYLGIGGVVSSVGSYLTYHGAKDNFDNAMQMKFPDHFGLPDFSEMGTKAFQETALIMYKIWEEDTQDIVVYNGNGTDWCMQCRESTKYSNGNMVDGGDFIFTDCPGVGFNNALWTVPGDWDYTEEKCDIIFNFFNHYFPSNAGIVTDDYYAPAEIDPLTLSMAQVGASIAGASIVAGVTGSYAALAVKDSVTRVSDSFSNEPQEILPGKRNKWLNAGVLTFSGIQSLIRSIPCGVAGWYYLQSRVDDHAFLGLLVGLTTVSSAMNYFCDFDTTYSAFPGKIRKAKSYLKRNVLPLLGINDVEYRDSHVICDDHLDQMNQLIHMFENAPVDMVKTIDQAFI